MDLRARLWDGPLPDPLAPARALALGDYAPALAGLRDLAAHGLPVAPALARALARWDWSIDLAVLAFDTGLPGALDSLRARVLRQNRRRAALARALWSLGDAAGALAVLAQAGPGSETQAADQALRAEYLLALAQDAGPALALALPGLPPGPAARLRLLAAWQTGGAAALAAEPVPGTAEGLALLIDASLIERDLPRTRAAAARLAALRAPGDPETVLDAARLALEGEDPDRARALLADLPPDPPWTWPPRRHVLHLRALLAQTEAAAWAQALPHARAAARLWPRHEGLRSLHWAAQEQLGDWDGLDAALAPLTDPQALGARARLGWPDPARLDPPPAPDAATWARAQAADLHLLAGDPAAALAVTQAPAPAPQAAGLAERRAEALLWDRQARAARALLDAALARHPTRLGLRLQRARAAFFLGDFLGSEADLQIFRDQKRGDTGLDPAPDLRDRITADAMDSGAALPPDEHADASRARLGAALGAHPGLAACWLARPGAVPAFRPVPDGAIPQTLALYWEGPDSGPVRRGIDRWRAVLPGWAVTVLDRDAARAWLAAQDPDGARAFDRLDGPAARADLLRACWLAQAGGVWADADEFPRADPSGWLEGASTVLVLESGYGTVANNFVAVSPGLPLVAAVRARILARLATVAQPYAWWDTGPAQWTGALAAALVAAPEGWPGLRILSQADYGARITTNLPFPHKSGPGHWRQGLQRGVPRGPMAP